MARSDALDALVNAALMAGENVTERVVRKVFSEALDLVVHVDREDGRAADPAAAPGSRRRVTEIVAVAPTLGDGFTTEAVYTHDGADRPLVWTGAVPTRLESRIDRAAGRAGALRAVLTGGVRGDE